VDECRFAPAAHICVYENVYQNFRVSTAFLVDFLSLALCIAIALSNFESPNTIDFLIP
jgi:hypothetical protein